VNELDEGMSVLDKASSPLECLHGIRIVKLQHSREPTIQRFRKLASECPERDVARAQAEEHGGDIALCFHSETEHQRERVDIRKAARAPQTGWIEARAPVSLSVNVGRQEGSSQLNHDGGR